MKKSNICIVFIFFVSSFLFINNVMAEYKATVSNPSGASCSAYTKGSSTGFCYYNDSNLNTYVENVIWLDTGDEVIVLEDGTHVNIESNDKSVCSDYYVYTSFYFSKKNKTFYGYYCNANLKSETNLSDEMKQQFKDAGFPESYWSKLAVLKEAHPNWTFKAINTGLKFSDAVAGETIGNRSLVQGVSANNYAYLSLDYGSFDYVNDIFYAYDNKGAEKWQDRWYRANYDTVAYYLDPRNFLSDMYIFQFEGLAYDESIPDEKILNTIKVAFKDDYLLNFSETFLTAGKKSKISPVYLAALSKQEVGNGMDPGTAISGVYNGMYNFYNIGATGDSAPVYNGLAFASKTDDSTLRPWDTEYDAIVGGALWMADEYISVGQDTSYFKRFNVIYNYLVLTGKISKPITNFEHQYMTNIMAPSSEATTSYRSYYDSGILDLDFVFYIPVYSDMPNSTSLPSKGGWPNNYLSSLTINGNKVADFDGNIVTYNYNLNNTNTIIIDASPVSGSATVNGLGTFTITEDTTKTISVTAENGDIKEYKIKIKVTNHTTEEAIDIVSILNNAGIKNGNLYLTGFNLGTDISTIKTKINNVNKVVAIELKDSGDKLKETGSIFTGDRVSLTHNGEVKKYEIVVYGDANGDGKISAVDYVKIKNNIMGTNGLSGVYKEAADVDRNGKVNAVDYVKIKNSIMGTGTIEQ